MLKFKVVKRPQPGVPGGGVMKYFPSVFIDGETDLDELIRRIEKYSSMTGVEVTAVVNALINEIRYDLSHSRTVRIDKLGAFHPRIHGTGSESPDDVNEKNINRVSIKFVSGPQLMADMKKASFKKVKNNGSK